MNNKIGVLLINLGTPDAPTRSAVYRYLKQFLLDPRVIDTGWLSRNLLVRGIIAPFRSGKSAKLYKELWTKDGSPIKVYGEGLAKGVQTKLGENYVVELAMRYQSPSIEGAINKLYKANVQEIIVFPLFPQYASATTGSIYEEVMRCLSEKQIILPLKFVSPYYDYQPMIDIFVENAMKHDISKYDHVLFSYHGVPQRHILKADEHSHCLKPNCCDKLTYTNQFCYCAQCSATTRALAKALDINKEKYTHCYQSRLGKDPWTQPYTGEVIKELAKKNKKKVLVFCPAFVADCLETSIEIGVEYSQEFKEAGGEELRLVESLNNKPKWIDVVSDLIKKNHCS